MIKFNNAFKISVLISCFLIFTIILVYFFQKTFDINIYILTILLFVPNLLVTYFLLNKFFYDRIKVIYKSIYKFKGTSKITEIERGCDGAWVAHPDLVKPIKQLFY